LCPPYQWRSSATRGSRPSLWSPLQYYFNRGTTTARLNTANIKAIYCTDPEILSSSQTNFFKLQSNFQNSISVLLACYFWKAPYCVNF
jgi:hypothetical protein